MVGSTQIMIRNGVYENLRRYRDTHKLRSFTEAIRELLESDAELERVYSTIPTHDTHVSRQNRERQPEPDI